MSTTLITTTRRGDFNALRYQGILVTESYAQIAAMLENSLSREYSLLLAEPVHSASGDSTDWYSPVQGTPVPLLSLPPEEQNRIIAAIDSLVKGISGLADSLKQDANPSKQVRGNILRMALQYPGREQIYVVNGQPVITCWGFGPGTVGAQPEDLLRLGAMAAVVPPSPPADKDGPAAPPPARAGLGWLRALLGFLLGLLLLLALFFLLSLLFGPSGCVSPNLFPGGCAQIAPLLPEKDKPAPQEPESGPQTDPKLVSSLTAEQEKSQSLRRQLEALRKQLADRAALCPRVPPVAEAPKPIPPKEEPPKEEPPQAPPALEDLMPLAPEPEPEPEPKPEPKPRQPEPKPKPAPKKPAKGEELRIPEEARRNNDMSFLEGCWNSETGLRNTRTGKPIQAQYCFDANGRGSRTVIEQDSGQRCTGSVRSRFDSSGRLRIDADGAPCPKGSTYVPQAVDCTTDSGGKAQCYGQELGGRKNRWQARFRRQ